MERERNTDGVEKRNTVETRSNGVIGMLELFRYIGKFVKSIERFFGSLKSKIVTLQQPEATRPLFLPPIYACEKSARVALTWSLPCRPDIGGTVPG